MRRQQENIERTRQLTAGISFVCIAGSWILLVYIHMHFISSIPCELEIQRALNDSNWQILQIYLYSESFYGPVSKIFLNKIQIK